MSDIGIVTPTPSAYSTPKPSPPVAVAPNLSEPIGDVPRTFTNPTLGVCIACVNEGPDLEATLACLVAAKRAPEQIVVVDDGSREPVEPRIRPFGKHTDLLVIRHERRLGSGPSKNEGLLALKTDLLCVMDSHLRPPWDWANFALDGFTRYPYSVLCPWSRGFEHRSAFVGLGCRFCPDEHGWLDCVWNAGTNPPPADGAVIGCVHGGCYIFGRKLLEHIGGYAPTHSGWGYEEVGLCWRAWACGFDVRLLSFEVPHYYRDTADRKDAAGNEMVPWEAWLNRHAALASIFEDGRYETVHRPIMLGHFNPPGLVEAIETLRPQINATRQHLKSVRTRSDAEIGRLIGVPTPSTIDEYRAIERLAGRSRK